MFCIHFQGTGPDGSSELLWSCVVRRPLSVRQFTFSPSSSEPLYGFYWNLVWMKYSRYSASADICRGGAWICHGGSLLKKTSSLDRKATGTHQIHSSDLEARWSGKKCCYFWCHSEVKFLTCVLRLCGLGHFVVFNAISIDFYAAKSFICNKVCEIFMFISGEMHIVKT